MTGKETYMDCTKCGKKIKVYCGDEPPKTDPIWEEVKKGNAVLLVGFLLDEKEMQQELESAKKAILCGKCEEKICRFDVNLTAIIAGIFVLMALGGVVLTMFVPLLGIVAIAVFSFMAVLLWGLRWMHLSGCKKHK